jgi:hypothetical protein
MLLASGQALLAIQNSGATYGSGLYISFLLVNLAGLILAIVMLKSQDFGRVVAIIGILANLFALGYYVTQAFAPKLNAVPISAAVLFLLVWYLLIGGQLLRLGWAA